MIWSTFFHVPWRLLATFLDRVSRFAERAGPWRLVFLLCFAVLYYSLYLLSGLTLRGEGGTVALISQRILEGARPIADTFTGYNLLWFYPIVWLFSIIGPNFLGVRIFFATLSVITGLLGYRVAWLCTRRPLLSLFAAAIIILIPGMEFRTYMGLLGVTGLLLLLQVFALEARSLPRLIWLLASGLFLGLTFLTRIDVGIFFLMLVAGCIIFYPLADLVDWRQRIKFSVLALVVYPLLIALVHIPADRYAEQHGFQQQFWSQYQGFGNDLVSHLAFLSFPVGSPGSVATPPAVAQSPTPAPTPDTETPGKPVVETNTDRSTRRRLPVTDIVLARTSGNRQLAFLIYCPILVTGLMVIMAAILLFRAWRNRLPQKGTDAFILLISAGSALTLLPQYFVFRPDPPHVSEMMCVLVIAIAVAYGVAQRNRSTASPLFSGLAAFYAVIATIHLVFYMNFGLTHASMGSIALRERSGVFFRAANGVTAYVSADRAKEYEELYKTIVEHSSPKDYVVCFPYQPTVNFMTDRRSYLYNLYVDNATEPPNFVTQSVADIEKYRPAVILVDDYAMNGTPGSRFTVWAKPVYDYIRQHYAFAGQLVENEVYLRIP
jgi:hypothetical protein